MIEAARKHKRMVQVGSQSRSTPHKMEAIAKLQDGVIGKLTNPRESATSGAFPSARSLTLPPLRA